MNVIFADTFYWIALTDVAKRAHRQALAITAERAAYSIVTTDEVLIEYLTLFSNTHERVRLEVVKNVRRILDHVAFRVIPQSRNSFISGLDLYGARPDKGYSLTDCISMAAMRREGLNEVLTNDRHFEQEGFRALFREF